MATYNDKIKEKFEEKLNLYINSRNSENKEDLMLFVDEIIYRNSNNLKSLEEDLNDDIFNFLQSEYETDDEIKTYGLDIDEITDISNKITDLTLYKIKEYLNL
jgi:ribosome recycling factor